MSAVSHPGVRRPPAVPEDQVWRFSVDQYHRMVSGGILTDDDPVELLEGWLISKMPKNPPHRLATRRTRLAIEAVLPAGWFVDSQEPITTEDSEPEPDVVVVRGLPEQYAERHPSAADVGLVVEVADTTLMRDRSLKKRVYAAAGVSVYWIVNLPEQCLEVYSEPRPGEDADYAHRAMFQPSDEVPLPLDGNAVGKITVSELLPPSPGT